MPLFEGIAPDEAFNLPHSITWGLITIVAFTCGGLVWKLGDVSEKVLKLEKKLESIVINGTPAIQLLQQLVTSMKESFEKLEGKVEKFIEDYYKGFKG